MKLRQKHNEQLTEFAQASVRRCGGALPAHECSGGDLRAGALVWSCQASFNDDQPWKHMGDQIAFTHWGLYMVPMRDGA